MFKKIRIFSLIAVVMLVVSACNLPQAPKEDPNTIMTVAAQTIEARLTQNILLTSSVTFTPPVTETPVPPSTTPTPATSLTPTAICDLAQYVTDVSVPDGTQFLPNQAFTKTWRLKNIGVCTWTSGYQLIFDNGDSMSGPATQALSETVGPGQTVDISVNLKAPSATGSYRGYWKLRNPSSVLIPIVTGFQGNSFFVDIMVVPPSPTGTKPAPGLTLVPIQPIGPIFLVPSKTPTPKFKIVPIVPIIPVGP